MQWEIQDIIPAQFICLKIYKMIITELKAHFINSLKDDYPETELISFFFLLTEKILNKTRLDLALDAKYKVNSEVLKVFDESIIKLKKQVPIQYIVGQTYFFDLTFKITPDVLIPRPETEELVQWILTENNPNKKLTILDIGTGSGCIAISLAKNLKNASVYALDVSKKALEIASYNAKKNKANVTFVHVDIRDDISKFKSVFLEKKFDIIVSNPPYVLEKEKKEMQDNVLKHEPALALFVSDDDPLFFYKKITNFSKTYLKDRGEIYFEINENYANKTVALLQANGFLSIKIRQDIYGKERMIKASNAIEI